MGNEKEETSAFENKYFRLSHKLIRIIGQWPDQSRRTKNIARAICLSSLWCSMPFLVLGILDLWDMPMVALCRGLPPILAIVGTTAKYNIYTIFEKEMWHVMTEIEVDWSLIREEQERNILELYANRGRIMAHFYFRYFFLSAVAMTMVPLRPCVMDYVAPLNESRQKMVLFPANYGRVNDLEDMYWLIVLHTNLGTLLLTCILVATDSMYFSLTYHVCGMFAITGHRLKHVSHNVKLNDLIEIDGPRGLIHRNKGFGQSWRLISDCIQLHNRSIWYASVLESCFTWSYFIVMCVNMIVISITGVLAIVRFEVYEESVPAFCFAGAQLLHLYFMSLPGQMLIDTSSAVRDFAYDSHWYTFPPKAQRLLIVIMLKSYYPCQITAGKFFVCKMETFSSISITGIVSTMLLITTLLRKEISR